MNNDFRIILEAVIDNSSLTNAQKKIAKEHFHASLDVELDIDKFAKQKKVLNQSIADMSEQLDKAFKHIGVELSDKELNSFAKEFLSRIQTMAKEEEKLIDTMAKVQEKTEQSRQSEQKRHQLAQDKAINKALEEEYVLRQKIQESIDNKSYEAEIAKLTKSFTMLSGDVNEAKTHVQALQIAYDEMVDATDDNARLVAEQKYQQTLSKTKNELVIAQANAKAYVDALKVSKLRNDIEDWLKKNTAATKEAKDAMQVYLSMLGDVAHVSQADFNIVKSGFDDWDTEMRKAGKLGKSLTETFKEGAKSFVEWMTASGAVMEIVYVLKDAVSELKEVDTLLTEISKANDKLSASDLAKIGDNSFDIASKYGKSATHYLSGVQEASRAGYENAEAIAEMSVAIQGAGDVTEDIANKYVIATDKAYGLKGSVEALTKVFDGTNYITNKNAVNMTELADGMSIVGSTAASFGIEVNETTAALGTLIASTQLSGSEMARAFRAILLNIRQVSDEEEGIDAEGLTKYEEACSALGVSLKETKNGVLQTRDAMKVLRDLSVEYNKLEEGDLRRTQLLNSVGGKLRANALDALLKNYDMYSKMLSEYEQGAGSMAREAEKTANSWEGASNRLSNTLTDTIENVLSSKAVIGTIDFFNTLLTGVNNLTDALGSLGTIGASAGLITGFKNVGKGKCTPSFV